MDGNGSAFPNGYNVTEDRGLSKRELFAAMAMQGAIVNAKATRTAELPLLFKHVAEGSVMAADALIAALSEEEKQ